MIAVIFAVLLNHLSGELDLVGIEAFAIPVDYDGHVKKLALPR